LFEAEAAGLEALRAPGDPPYFPRVPRVLAVEPGRLVLEDLGVGHPSTAGWAQLGRALAALHRETRSAFGFDRDNFIGRTPQTNAWTAKGPTFFAEQRLLPLTRACEDANLLDAATGQKIEKICARLSELLPDEAPALIHGDLWTGNIHPTPDGSLALIDPATHFGYREADLAMTYLFGCLPEAFHASYDAAWPLAPGARERTSLFNLYHLLNHLLLFGPGYRAQVSKTVRAWT